MEDDQQSKCHLLRYQTTQTVVTDLDVDTESKGGVPNSKHKVG